MILHWSTFYDTLGSLLMRVLRSSLVFSSAAVLALRERRATGTDSGTFSPSLRPHETQADAFENVIIKQTKGRVSWRAASAHLSSEDSALLLAFLPPLAVLAFL